MERLCASDTTRRLDVNVVMETWAIHKTARIEGAELDATIVIGGASAGDMAGVAITGTVSGAVILQPGALPGLAAIKGGGGGVVVTASADAATTCRSGRARNGTAALRLATSASPWPSDWMRITGPAARSPWAAGHGLYIAGKGRWLAIHVQLYRGCGEGTGDPACGWVI